MVLSVAKTRLSIADFVLAPVVVAEALASFLLQVFWLRDADRHGGR